MVRHIVMWNLQEGFTAEENLAHAEKIKQKLEALSNMPGVVSLQVLINPLEGSNRIIMLNSLFENEDALAAYQVSPGHVEAGKFIRSVVADRACMDYQE